MALFKIEKGLAANLAKNRPDTVEGYCYVTTDNGKMYIDIQKGTGTANNPAYRIVLNAGHADTAAALTTSAGSAIQPVYFENGKPVKTTYTLGKSVPSNAKFTDTTYSNATSSTAGLMSANDKSTLDGIASTYAKQATTITAGDGLTGGGSLAGNRTIAVGAGAGISVTADAVALSASGVTAGTYGPSTNISGSNGTTVSIPEVTVDTYGRVTKVINRTYTSVNTDTDTKVTQTVTTSNAAYPLLLAPSGQTTTATTTSYFDSGVTLNPSTNTIAANISGNAATATKLANARTISLSGDVSGNANFNGESNITISTTVADSSHNHSADNITVGYLNTHPQNNPVLIPMMHNDIAYLLKRGGSAIVKFDTTTQSVDISNVFDGSPSYWTMNPSTASTTSVTIELTLHKEFGWTNTIYVDFGSSSWRSKSVKIEVINTNYANDVWTLKGSTTTNNLGHYYIRGDHTPVGAADNGGGFNKIRFTFSDWYSTNTFRIAALGVYNYSSAGLRETFLARDGGTLLGGINPQNNNSYDIGSSSLKWRNMYATTFNGALNGNATTATTLQKTRTINGTNFNGSANIETSYWGAARLLKVGYKEISVNGNANVTWDVHDILLNTNAIGTASSWNVLNSGVYSVASADAFTGTGNPESANGGLAPYRYGQLIVSRAGTSGLAQFYISHNDSNTSQKVGIKYRTGWNNTYVDTWESILDTSNFNNYAPTLTGTGATGTWGISITGNAATATALGSNAGSTTQPIYFSGGKPVACGTSLAVSITGNAATATTASVCSGNAATATKLATAQTISLTGDVTGSASFTGNTACAITATVADNSHNHTWSNISDRASCTIKTSGTITGSKVYGAVWNDYAEYRTQKEIVEPGYCVTSADNGQVYKTTEKFQACDGIVSDTFGFAIGETDKCKTPLAVAGRVLAYCEGNRNDYHSGDTVCAGPEGKVMKMTREEIREWPDRIIGIVSEIPKYETWGTGNVPVNGRIWIKIK